MSQYSHTHTSTHIHSLQSGLTALDVARAESHQAVCEVIEQHLNQGAKVNPQLTGGQEEDKSHHEVGECGQDLKTELTEVGYCRHTVRPDQFNKLLHGFARSYFLLNRKIKLGGA